MDSVCEDLGIPKQHVQETASSADRFIVIVEKSWLKCLEQKKKLRDFPIYPGLDKRSLPDLGHSWTKVYMHIYKKFNHKVIPLPRSRAECSDDLPFTFSEILTSISTSNYRNLWKEAYQKYDGSHIKFARQSSSTGSGGFSGTKKKIEPNVNLVPYDIVLRELIQRMFGCCIIHSKLDRVKSPTDPQLNAIQNDCHPNLMFAIAAVETRSHISVVFHPPIESTLYDCITYSPAILSKSHNKPLFIFYQIFQLVKHLRENGLMIGELKLQDIYIQENLWIRVIPKLESNIIQLESDDTPTDDYSDSIKFDLKFAFDLQQFSLREYSEMWCNGQLSNFDYLTILNNASGRRLGCPEYYHIMPWVTDFTHRNGMNWRDLTKSKYRINKGDPHLDLMFTPSNGNEIPHHVSDFLSEITYFVYMARRTPQNVLCQHVRPIWVPAEYPASIQRLQEWTPDECIPGFYTDPMVFRSIHEDLPDLELPVWATCPEDFIAKHREALESQYVSERLHHWIDLNFGYKLVGQAAVKSKNVCLTLIDNHKNLCQRGIVQLFTHPHPSKRFPSNWFGKSPPRISSSDQKRRMTRSSEDLTTKTNLNENDPYLNSPARKYNTSPKASHQSSSPKIPEDGVSTNIERSTSYHTNVQKSSNTIYLPKDYNPCALINNLENIEMFFAKTFLNQKPDRSQNEKFARNDLMFDESSDNSFTNRMFSETFEAGLMKDNKRLHNVKYKNLIVQNTTRHYELIMAERYSRELQIIGCLIVELFLMNKLRPIIATNDSQTFEMRLNACKSVAKSNMKDIPKCMQYAVKLFLQFDINSENRSVLTNLGLPNPSAHQILQPILSNSILPFPHKYFRVYALITCLQNFDSLANLLAIRTYFQCDGSKCSRFDDLDRKRVVYSRKIAECKVKACCLHIDGLLEHIGYEQFNCVEILLPHIIYLLTCEETSILTAWYLFDPIATVLGLKDTQKYLLEPILRLYDDENERTQFLNKNFDSSIKFTTSSSFKSRKSLKLYHHRFLLRLLIRFGMKCFLENFVAPLIEAVGGYKEPEESNGFHYHSSSMARFRSSRSAKNLKFCCNDESDNSVTLISPDHSELISDNTISQDCIKPEIEVFTFETENELDENTDKISSTGSENKSVDSLDLRLNHSNAEEAVEDIITISPEKIAIDDIIYGNQKLSNNSFEDDKVSVNSQTEKSPHKLDLLGPKSPTIPIPTAFHRSYELSTIDCEIGSKKSVDSIDLVPQNDVTLMRNASICSETDESLHASIISRISEARMARNNRISEMSTESLIWLSHRLGPVLTARHLTRNLLKMLTLCYVGQENILPDDQETNVDEGNLNYFTIADSRVIGDHNAARVLECLTSIVALYGEQFILLQYLPHVSELITLCKKRITPSLEGALISSLQLLKYLIPCLVDSTIMEHLHDTFLHNIINPIIRLLGSSRCLMPSGFLARSVLSRKLLDAIYVLSVRIGPEMSKEHLCIPALQRFFLIFDKAYGVSENFNCLHNDNSSTNSSEDSNFTENRRSNNKSKEWDIKGINIFQSKSNNGNNNNSSSNDMHSNESVSPPKPLDASLDNSEYALRERALEEIRDVFSPNLAHCSYLAFLRFLGESIMSRTIINISLILNLCHEFEQPDYSPTEKNQRLHNFSSSGKILGQDDDFIGSNCFGTPVIGNRIEVKNVSQKHEMGPMEVLDLVAYKLEPFNITRHLRGNWLAYWEHEIGRSEKDNHLNLKQIKLQTFAGHTNSVRAIISLDNENSFMSASKDKTVKLWSLRSEGDGKKVSSCQFTYTNHKKSVHSLAFLESMRFMVSCDSGVHVWDPFIGSAIGILDSQTKYTPVSVVRTYPTPSPLILAGTAESTVKIIDSRTVSYVNEWKVNFAQSSAVRCMACAPSGNWVAVGLSSGNIILLDGRMGMILGSWKATDGELLQLVAPNDQQIISSSLDHSISVWNVNDITLQFQLKQPPEPAHCLSPNGTELVFATPANRIGVYSNLSSSDGTYSITKLRSENLKGVLTSLAVLPLNRMILAGNDSGNIVLLC